MHRLGLIFVCAGLLGGCFADPAVAVPDDDPSGATTGDSIEASGTTSTPTPGTSGSPPGTTDVSDDESSTTVVDDDDDDDSGSTTSGGEVGTSSSEGGESSSSGPVLDCDGVPDGDAVLDECGVCNGPGGPCWGCTVPAASNYDPLAEINDGTCTCNVGAGGVTDQSNLFSDAGSGGTDQWQSFTTGVAGGLSRIDLGVGSPVSGPSPGTIRIYEGEGTGGTELGSQEVTFEDVFNTVQEFTLESAIPLDANSVYTIRFTVPDITVGWVDVAPDVYAGGRASYGSGTDFVFRTIMTQCIPD